MHSFLAGTPLISKLNEEKVCLIDENLAEIKQLIYHDQIAMAKVNSLVPILPCTAVVKAGPQLLILCNVIQLHRQAAA